MTACNKTKKQKTKAAVFVAAASRKIFSGKKYWSSAAACNS